MRDERDPLDTLPAYVIAFAEAIFDRYDVGSVVDDYGAAVTARVSESTARECIRQLKAAKCWPYRGRRWKETGWKFARLSA